MLTSYCHLVSASYSWTETYLRILLVHTMCQVCRVWGCHLKHMIFFLLEQRFLAHSMIMRWFLWPPSRIYQRLTEDDEHWTKIWWDILIIMNLAVGIEWQLCLYTPKLIISLWKQTFLYFPIGCRNLLQHSFGHLIIWSKTKNAHLMCHENHRLKFLF